MTEGYYIILQDGKIYNFENFVIDQLSYNYSYLDKLCEKSEDLESDFIHYQENQGEVRINRETYYGPKDTQVLEVAGFSDIEKVNLPQYTINACSAKMDKISALSKE